MTQLQSCKSAEHLFTIGVPGGKRDQAIATLNEAGVGVTVNYRAVPETTFYKKLLPEDAFERRLSELSPPEMAEPPSRDLPVAEVTGVGTLQLPLATLLS